MNISVFLKRYKEGVKTKTGKVFSVTSFAKLIGVDNFRLTKWIEGKGQPKEDNDRLYVKLFFGIENLSRDIREDVLIRAIERYPEGLANIEDLNKQADTNNKSESQGYKHGTIEAGSSHSKKTDEKPFENQGEILISEPGQAFTKFLPMREDRNAWLPQFTNSDEILERYGDSDTIVALLKKDKLMLKAPLYARIPNFTAQFTVKLKTDDMSPRYPANCTIGVRYIDLDMYLPGKAYLIWFKNQTREVYYLDEGKDDLHLHMYSERNPKGRNMPIASIDKIFMVGGYIKDEITE